MYNSNVFRVFPNDPIPPAVDYAKGSYIYTKDGRKLLDTTAGGTSYSILGWNNDKINNAIIKQLNKFAHMDYKIWTDDNVEELSSLLLSKAEHTLNRVYFSGNSGGEACEAAMKMSYQAHFDLGKTEKRWFISREQSYHGSSSDALALGERPNLEFYAPMLPKLRARIPMHHPLYLKRDNESLDEYAKRSAKELEEKILEIGSEKICAFVGETIMGGLVGDVPPAPNYWKYIRQICDKYDVHLILDEVYCGTGTSGKVYCCDWDKITPDFIFIGKTLAAGYGVLSAVITSSKIEDIIKNGQKRLQHTTTHQAHSLSVAAALSVQKHIHHDHFLSQVYDLGKYMQNTLFDELKDLALYKDIRGRGLRFSFEYQCENNSKFATKLTQNMQEKHNILISAKWHRVSFTPPLILTINEVNKILDTFIKEVRLLR